MHAVWQCPVYVNFEVALEESGAAEPRLHIWVAKEVSEVDAAIVCCC